MYQIVVSAAFLLVLPLVPVVWLVSEKRRANLLQRLGILTGLKKKSGVEKRIWIHALSVGEVRSALPLVTAVRQRLPHMQIVFTAATRTGFDTAHQLFCSPGAALVSQIAYFPFDLPWSVARIRHLIAPDLVCLVETDLWPGFLDAMHQNDIPVVLVNARLSRQSFNRYRRLGRISALFFSGLTHILVQTRQDHDRFWALGVSQDRLTLAGNIKFDQPILVLDEKQKTALRTWFGVQKTDKVWIAGSTHPGEEVILGAVYHQVRQAVPELKMIVAPRDPARSGQVADAMAREGTRPVLLSHTRQNPVNTPVMVLDCLGVLAGAYSVCDVAFIGGSLVPCGGHNPLEPAVFKKPIVFGPHMTDFLGIATLLLENKAACQVPDRDGLAQALQAFLLQPDLAGETGSRAFSVCCENTGAVDRTLDTLAGLGLVDAHE